MSEEERIDPKKWGWGTWLVIDLVVGLAIAILYSIFGG